MPRTTAIFFGSSNSTRSYRLSGTRQALGGARSTLRPTSSWADSGLAGLFRSLTDARVSIEGEYKVVIGDAVLSDVDVPKKWE